MSSVASSSRAARTSRGGAGRGASSGGDDGASLASEQREDEREEGGDDDEDEPAQPAKKKARTAAPKGKGKGKSEQRSSFPLFELPAEIIDQILADPVLDLRDHLSLAGTSRTLRSAYYTPPPPSFFETATPFSSPLWSALMSSRPFLPAAPPHWSLKTYGQRSSARSQVERIHTPHERLIRHLWGREDRVPPGVVKVMVVRTIRTGRTRNAVKDEIVPAVGMEWEKAVVLMHERRLTAEEAAKRYKLSERQHTLRPCMIDRGDRLRSLVPRKPTYFEAAVAALAVREGKRDAGEAPGAAVAA
ncbi:hypothetical protein JCM10213_000943 [Rhodosporidiobolus nylandii]